jgi:hypothetical protein
MEYGIELQYIIDELKAEAGLDAKWRNKVIARLEEVQVYCLMLREKPSFDTTPGLEIYDEASSVDPAIFATVKPVTIDQIPESLREHADPNKLQPPTI